PRRQWRSSGPKSLGSAERAAMRLLSIRPDHGCCRTPQGETQTHRQRYRTSNVEHLPLRHLHAHSGSHPTGSGGTVMLIIENLSRRGFLKPSAAASAALVLGTRIDRVGRAWAAAPTLSPNVFI